MSSGPVACSLQDTGDTVAAAAHGLLDGDRVVFATILLTTGVITNTEYFVVNKATNTFQVSATSGGAALSLTTDGSGAFVHRNVVVGSTSSSGDFFGSSVDANATYLVVGAQDDDDAFSDAGAAYIYEKSGDAWVEVIKFTGADAGALFGGAVAVGGEVIAIGAPNADTYGAVYVYKRVTGTWTLQQKLITSVPQVAQQSFGRALAISADGEVIIVGMQNAGFPYDGGAFAYHYNSGMGQWDNKLDITASDLAANDANGSSVAVSADGLTCVVGSPIDSDTVAYSGSIYVYNYSGATWSQTAKLHASDPAGSDYFGMAVGISADGTVIAVAAPKEDDGGVDAGAIYIFELSGTWAQTDKLVSYVGPAASRYLGYRGTTTSSEPGHQHIVFIGSTTILVPSTVDRFYSSAYSGTCRCFSAKTVWGSGYTEYAIFPDDAVANLRFGQCAIAGSELIVGCASGDGATGASGVVYSTRDLPWASSSGAVDTTAPTVTLISPADGTTVAADASMMINVTDETGLAKFVVWAEYNSEVAYPRATELVWDGDEFVFPFNLYSSSVTLDDSIGTQLSIKRTGGWKSSPTIEVIAIDSSGNDADPPDA